VALVLFKPEGIAGLFQGAGKARPGPLSPPARSPQPQPQAQPR